MFFFFLKNMFKQMSVLKNRYDNLILQWDLNRQPHLPVIDSGGEVIFLPPPLLGPPEVEIIQ